MPRSEITREYIERELHNEATIILISSFSSALTYILLDKMVNHWKHPVMFIVLSIGFIAVFYLVITLLRLKKLHGIGTNAKNTNNKMVHATGKNAATFYRDEKKLLKISRV